MGKQLSIMLGIAVLVIGGGILLFLNEDPSDRDNPVVFDPDHVAELVRDHSFTTGNPDAKVQVVEFGDLQCPACASAFPNVRKVIDAYGDQIQFVYRHFPLEGIHPHAFLAAQAAEAAKDQGNFKGMEEILFTRQRDWSVGLGSPINKFAGYAEELGLNREQFLEDIDSGKYKDRIRLDQQDGTSLGVNSTPSFFINGERLSGGFSFENFKQKIDLELTKE